ncbi:uncharacterized protein LOC143014330 isoform X4 [Genypterus blacodes]|uniref:uncharacterized protein LOC143014330 isoform X4 n=1 Tax=Genypterus blacodes TaxID=154954 RepID=UPI003F758E8C
MAKYFRSKENRDLEVHKSEIFDHQEKETGENIKSQQKKHLCRNQHHHYQHQSHQSDDNDSHGSLSTVEGRIFHNRHHENHHQCDSDGMDQSPLHHSVPGSSLTSSSSSSYSSSSSSSSSSYSSTSTSSSSLSSDTSSEGFKRCRLGKPQHSQSCNDISRKQKFFDEEDDTTPLIDDECQLKKERHEKTKYCPGGPLKNTRGITNGPGKDESFRKAKSMESLSRPKKREGHETEVERRKNEARKNLLKEKLKFSAFLNEITQQVLSPMKLTSLGVTDTHRKRSPGPASDRSTKTVSSTEKFNQQRNQHGSADSEHSSSEQLRHGRQTIGK